VISIQNISDLAILCPPNDFEASLIYIIAGDWRCEATPSPFTPNGDEFNPVVNIIYPKMDKEKADINIYTLAGEKVRTIKVDSARPGFGNAFWNGKNERGNDMPAGLYVYIVERNGKIICKGSVISKKGSIKK
jgi:hypothetical protein